MGNLITREQLINYFIQSSHFLNRYVEIGLEFEKNGQIDIKQLEQKIDIYRRHKNFELLIPLLILAAHDYIDNNNHQIATLYLIECHALLKEIDPNCMVRLLVFLELGYALERDKHYKEASYYYMNALYFSIEKKLDIFIKYAMHQLGLLTILSNSQKDAFDYRSIFEEYSQWFLTDMSQSFYEIERLHHQKDYEGLYAAIINTFQNESLMSNSRSSIILKLCEVIALYQIKRIDDIQWIDEAQMKSSRESICDVYWLEYDLVSSYVLSPQTFITYIQKLENKLMSEHKEYLLDIMYDKVLQYDCIKNDKILYESLMDKCNENKDYIYKRETKMKDRLQDIHSNYKQYYQRMDPCERQTIIEKLDAKSFKDNYEKKYSNQIVLGMILVNEHFYKSLPEDVIHSIIDDLGNHVGGNLTYSVDETLFWFSFKSYETEMKLKQKLNQITQHLYEHLNKELIVAICLPKQCEHDFEMTKERVHESIYNAVLQDNQDEPYQFVYYRKGLQHADVSKKFKQLVLKAKQDNKIIFREEQVFKTDCQEVYGIEFSMDIIGFEPLIQIIEVKEHWVKEAAITEMEILLVETASAYMKQRYQNHSTQPCLFIKLSRETLLNPFSALRICEWIRQLDMNHEKIVFEINESTIFEKNPILTEAISKLKDAGFNISLDEYGTGTLTGSIRNVCINYLKISEYLLNEIKRVNDKHFIMQSLTKICSERNIKLLCSNIESEVAHCTIRNFGINLASGAYYQLK